MFQGLMASIADDVVKYIFRVQVQQEAPPPPRKLYNPVEVGAGDAQPSAGRSAAMAGGATAATAMGGGIAVGRNDPCPCGSGKKFKKCHGA